MYTCKKCKAIELHVYVGGEKVTDYVIKDINGRTVSTGKCPILT